MNAVAKTGRPSSYTDLLVTEICERLAAGEPLAVICRDEHMPSTVTVGNWARMSPDLSFALAHARDLGADMIAWRSRKTIRGLGPELGGESTGDVARDKAIVDHDLKLLKVWNPKKYGDRMAVTGADGGAVEFRAVVDPAKLSADERDALRELLERAAADEAVDVSPNSGDGE